MRSDVKQKFGSTSWMSATMWLSLTSTSSQSLVFNFLMLSINAGRISLKVFLQVQYPVISYLLFRLSSNVQNISFSSYFDLSVTLCNLKSFSLLNANVALHSFYEDQNKRNIR